MFRINKITDYGIVLLVDMCRRADSRSAQKLAQDTGIPLPTVSKLMKHLVPAGLVISQRGVQGGYRIARDAAEINVAHVVEALEGPIALTACLDEGDDQCCIEHTCPMSSHWSKINTAVRQALEGVTLASMVHTDVIFGLPVPPPPSAHTDGYGHKA